MNQPPQILAIGQSVNYDDEKGKVQKATITRIYHSGAAHLEFQNGSAVADFSDQKEPGTFHFPQSSPASAKAEK